MPSHLGCGEELRTPRQRADMYGQDKKLGEFALLEYAWLDLQPVHGEESGTHAVLC